MSEDNSSTRSGMNCCLLLNEINHGMWIPKNKIVTQLFVSATKEDPTPLSPCKNDAEKCDGIVDALGICVCGKEIRTLGFVGTYSDSSCTEVVEELPRPKIPTEACFHLSAFYWKSLFAPKTVSVRVSCLPGNTGANFKLWNGLNCEGESVAEANVFPDQCVYGGLETFLRGRDIWVIDETCTVP